MIHSPSKQKSKVTPKISLPKERKSTRLISRYTLAAIFVLFLGLIIVSRLVFLMIIGHDYYKNLALGSQEVSSKLMPKRGEIFMQDTRTGERYPFAINRDYFTLFADTREIKDDQTASTTANFLAEIFAYNDEKKQKVYEQLNKRTDPYEPIENKVEEGVMNQIKSQKISGLHFTRKSHRFYPEAELGASIVGFVGKNDEGFDTGRYGIEGYFQKELSGEGGFVEGTKSAGGRLIALSGFKFQDSKDGAAITLTIDRTLEFEACKILREGMIEYGAVSASLIIMDPVTGAVRAMCSIPDFNPNEYTKVESADVFNNSSIFTPYEPGSIFKPITMAAALNEGLIHPHTPFYDSGVRSDICKTSIRNAEFKVYKDTDMNGVLQNSINTGMIWIAEHLGTKKFREYVEQFGFGVKTGIQMDTESSGTIGSLSKNKKEESIDCYTATGSFGQGLTVTPLQMVVAFAAIANGGHLMKPYIIDTIEYGDGKVHKVQPEEVRRVVSAKTSALLSGMLVNVVEEGHAKAARTSEYYIGGKTGTAQIPGPGGYTAETIHSFVGFAPVGDPKFVMIVKYEKPQRKYAESTAVPVFKKISDFILNYYQVKPNRS